MSLPVCVAASRVESETITDQLPRLLRGGEHESKPAMTRIMTHNEFFPVPVIPNLDGGRVSEAPGKWQMSRSGLAGISLHRLKESI